MKFAIVFLAFVGYAYGGAVHGFAAPAVGIVNTGASAQFRSQDNLGNYAFGYNEDHSTGGTFRRESGGPGHQTGSYGLRDIDGRVRVVNYVADAGGFRANVQTNEPGVEPKDPASVLINKAAAIVAAPAVALAAPAPLAAPLVASYAAPYASHVAYGAPVAYDVPRVSSYSTVTQHVAPGAAVLAAAPAVSYAAPLAAYGAPLAAYGAPLAAPYGAPLAHAGYATKTLAAW